MTRKRISVSNELHILIRAIDGVRVLADRWTDSATGGDFEDDALPHVIAANLTVVRERLWLLDRIVRDTIDPATMWCPENSALPPHEKPTIDDIDVVLAAWSDKKRARRLRREWKMAKSRAQRKEHK